VRIEAWGSRLQFEASRRSGGFWKLEAGT